MAEGKLEQKDIKSGDWVMIYVIFVALSLTMLGLVMLFSAGVVKGAQALPANQAGNLVGSFTSHGNIRCIHELGLVAQKIWVAICILHGLPSFDFDSWCGS